MPITQDRMLALVGAAMKIQDSYLRTAAQIQQFAGNKHPALLAAISSTEDQATRALIYELRDQILAIVRANAPDSNSIRTIGIEEGKLSARKRSNENHASYMRRRRLANHNKYLEDQEDSDAQIAELFGERPAAALPTTAAIPLRLEPITLPELRDHLWSKFGPNIIYQSQVAEELVTLGEPNLPEQIRIIRELLESDLAKPGEFSGEILLTAGDNT